MPSPQSSHFGRGPIIPIGGAEDKEKERPILARFAAACGGADGCIAVIPTASRVATTGGLYREVFGSLGVGAVEVVDVEHRATAADPRWSAILERATGIFFTGGDQLRLSTILGGTNLAQVVRRRNAAGCPVAGTSAGAAFLSEHMIAFGDPGSTPRVGNVTLAPGLGLTNRVIIDQHFRQRDRLGRLLSALSYNPFSIGLGLDEDTAAFIDPADVVSIAGTGALTIVDVGDLEHSAMADTEVGRPVDLVGVRLHVLSEGGSFDLVRRRARPAVRTLVIPDE